MIRENHVLKVDDKKLLLKIIIQHIVKYLQKSHKAQSLKLSYLKCYYKFLITDVLLNAWEENRIDIHI
jgi:hypothetical protein